MSTIDRCAIGSDETYLETTPVVDTETQAMLDVHYTTKRRHNTQIDLQSLASDKGYDFQEIRNYCRSVDTRPLIKHREFTPLG